MGFRKQSFYLILGIIAVLAFILQGCQKKITIPKGTYEWVDEDETFKNEKIIVSKDEITLVDFNWDIRIMKGLPILALQNGLTSEEEVMKFVNEMKSKFDYEAYRQLKVPMTNLIEINIGNDEDDPELVYELTYVVTFSNGYDLTMCLDYSPKKKCFVGENMQTGEIVPIYDNISE